jgi:hypothetical protein
MIYYINSMKIFKAKTQSVLIFYNIECVITCYSFENNCIPLLQTNLIKYKIGYTKGFIRQTYSQGK